MYVHGERTHSLVLYLCRSTRGTKKRKEKKTKRKKKEEEEDEEEERLGEGPDRTQPPIYFYFANTTHTIMADSDPFIVVKEEVEQSVTQADKLYARWKELYTQADADMQEFEYITNELRTNLKSIEWDLEDLDETVTIVEQSPDRFKITQEEVRQRKKFISDTRAKVKRVRAETSEKKAKGKAAEQDRAALISQPALSRYAKLDAAIDQQNSEFIEGQGQRQDMIMQEQDKQLEEVGQTIGVLKHMGSLIGEELEEQNDLLTAFDDEMDTTTNSLKRTMQKLDKALAITRDGKQSCCLCLCILVTLILIIVYFSR